jgi:hypothetical protein
MTASQLCLLTVAGAFLVSGCDSAPLRLGPVMTQGAPGSGEPNLFATPDGRVLLSWLEPTADGYALRVAMRDDEAWHAARTVHQSSQLFVNWADFPSVIERRDGAWVAHWLERVATSTYAYHVRIAVSHDRGASWSPPFTPHRDRSATEHGFVSLVPGDDDTVHLVWLDGQGTAAGEGVDRAMQLRSVTMGGDDTVAVEGAIDTRVCDCCQTALARTSDGLIVAYRDRSEGEIRDIAVARWRDGSWTNPTIVGNDQWRITGCPVNGPSLSARQDTVVVAWFAAPDTVGRVQVAWSTDAGASFGTPIRVDGGAPLGRVDVELQRDGALVLWMERVGEIAEIRARLVRFDGSLSPHAMIGTTTQSRASGFARMASVGDDLVFAWTEGSDAPRILVAWGTRRD